MFKEIKESLKHSQVVHYLLIFSTSLLIVIGEVCLCPMFCWAVEGEKPKEERGKEREERGKEREERDPKEREERDPKEREERDPKEREESGDEITVRVQERKGQHQKVKTHHINLYDLLSESSAYLTQSGGSGSSLHLSFRGAAGHHHGVYFEGIPLHNLRSQALDLQLFPLQLLASVETQGGGEAAFGGGGEASGKLTLQSNIIPLQPTWVVKMNTNTQRSSELGVSYGYRGSRGGGLFMLTGGGGLGDYTYTDIHGLIRRRVGTAHQHISGFTRWLYTPSWGVIEGVVGIGGLKRGEPGPEGLDLIGRHTRQQLLYTSTIVRPHWRKINADLRVYATQHKYHFTETEPIWQSQGAAQYDYLDQRFGLKSHIIYPIHWGKVGLQLNASSTSASTNTHTAGREQAGISPYVQVQMRTSLSFTLTSRVDLNTERKRIIVPYARLRWLFNTPNTTSDLCQLKGSRIFRDPGFDERYLVGPGVLPNPHLRAEDGGWIDLGCSLQLKMNTKLGRINTFIKLTGFYQRFSRLILYVPLDPYRIQATDQLSSEVKGAELYLSVRSWSSYLPITLQGHLNIQRHQLTDSPFTPLPLIPSLYGWARLSLHLSSYQLWLKGVGRAQVTTDRFAQRMLPSSVLWHLGVDHLWRVQDQRWSLGMSFQNIFNTSTRDFILRPLPGRQVWIRLSFQSV